MELTVFLLQSNGLVESTQPLGLTVSLLYSNEFFGCSLSLLAYRVFLLSLVAYCVFLLSLVAYCVFLLSLVAYCVFLLSLMAYCVFLLSLVAYCVFSRFGLLYEFLQLVELTESWCTRRICSSSYSARGLT